MGIFTLVNFYKLQYFNAFKLNLPLIFFSKMLLVATLHKKSGSASPLRVFRAAVRKMIVANHLPDYTMAEVSGDMVCFTRADLVVHDAALQIVPTLKPETLERARALLPGVDVYALEAEWGRFWITSGQPRLRDADKAFEG